MEEARSSQLWWRTAGRGRGGRKEFEARRTKICAHDAPLLGSISINLGWEESRWYRARYSRCHFPWVASWRTFTEMRLSKLRAGRRLEGTYCAKAQGPGTLCHKDIVDTHTQEMGYAAEIWDQRLSLWASVFCYITYLVYYRKEYMS